MQRHTTSPSLQRVRALYSWWMISWWSQETQRPWRRWPLEGDLHDLKVHNQSQSGLTTMTSIVGLQKKSSRAWSKNTLSISPHWRLIYSNSASVKYPETIKQAEPFKKFPKGTFNGAQYSHKSEYDERTPSLMKPAANLSSLSFVLNWYLEAFTIWEANECVVDTLNSRWWSKYRGFLQEDPCPCIKGSQSVQTSINVDAAFLKPQDKPPLTIRKTLVSSNAISR